MQRSSGTTAYSPCGVPGRVRTAGSPRVLVVCTLDMMAWVLLRPYWQTLLQAGCEVHLACSRTTYVELLAREGLTVHEVPLRRRLNPLVNLPALWLLYRLMRRYKYALVNTHSPVAAAVARLAAWVSGVRLVVYTVHGFHFHEDMPRVFRKLFITIEWLLGKVTRHFLFVSEEDQATALREGIAPNAEATTVISNGIDLDSFPSKLSCEAEGLATRARLGIPPTARVVVIVARIVKEKGYREFLEMATAISSSRTDVFFLVVGDALPSDHGRIGHQFRTGVKMAGLESRFRFTGFTPCVSEYLRAADIFVLPSYREGFPRSVLEAMASGLPVVATMIRGCREAVVDGVTGLLVPPRDSRALTCAVASLLDNPDAARRMGAAGRLRAVRLYDQRLMQHRIITAFERLLGWSEVRTGRSKAMGSNAAATNATCED